MTPPANVERQISRRASKGATPVPRSPDGSALPLPALSASPAVAGAVEAHKWFSGTSSKDGMRNFIAGTVSGFACKIVEFVSP